MQAVIDKFDGEHRFLSNFYWFKLPNGQETTVEHLYQAAKTHDLKAKAIVMDSNSPSVAKARGNRVPLRPDWEEVKRSVMFGLVWKKFNSSLDLADKLMSTEFALLVEGNTWGDKYWGMVPDANGEGENHLGKILMQVRARLRKERNRG